MGIMGNTRQRGSASAFSNQYSVLTVQPLFRMSCSMNVVEKDNDLAVTFERRGEKSNKPKIITKVQKEILATTTCGDKQRMPAITDLVL
jgi:hypothetical protein